RRPLHGAHDPGGARRGPHLRPTPGGAAGRDGRPGAPGAADPPGLHRQEPADPPRRGRERHARRRRARRAAQGGPVMQHLLGIEQLTAGDIEHLLSQTDRFVEVSRRRMPKVPALQGRTVTWLFYEDSTRTRLSFEQAAKRLSADTLSFAVSSSSVRKGESLRDTVQTIEA